MNRIYISGKISGLSKNEYMQNFAHTHLMLLDRYGLITKIINPLDIKPIFGIKKWIFYMISDLWQLRKCTHIAMQPNWIDSKGACIEHFYAKFILKLHVIYL